MNAADGRTRVGIVRSIRRTLLVWLVGPLVLLLGLGWAADYRMSTEATTRAYDEGLLGVALGLQRLLRSEGATTTIDLPGVADTVVRAAQDDQIYYLVRDPYGELLAGDPGLPAPPSIDPRAPVIYDGVFEDVNVRIAAWMLPCGDALCLIQVAETTRKRDGTRLRLLSANLGPELVLALGVVLFVWFGVKRGLRPLSRLSDEIRERSPADLRPIPATALPSELQPIVNGLNTLFMRVTEAAQSQRRFTANAAHQLRTPLAVLRTHLELALVRGTAGQDKEQLAQAHGAVVRASHLVGQLLALARAETGAGREIARQVIDLADVVESMADDVVHPALARNIDLGFELAHVHIAADALLIRESLANLVFNAIQYIPAGGRITVRCGRDGARAFVEVEDDGPGIPVAERERVVERFYRLPDATGIGSGLGLAIVREITQAHGGTVALLDGHEGRGCRARLTFALASA